MRVLVSSDETGLIKEVICSKGTDTSKKDGLKPQSIEKVCKKPTPSLKSRILQMIKIDAKLITIRLNGELCIYDMNEKEIITEGEEDYKLIQSIKLCDDKPISLLDYSKFNSVIVAFETNKIFIVDLKSFKFKELIIPYEKKVKPITSFINNPFTDGEFAFGGEENDVKIIKFFEKPAKNILSTKFNVEIIKTFRNVPNNHLDLRVPISIKSIRFITKDKFITSTKYGQLRVYDINTERPINDFKIGEKPIIQLALCNDNQEIILSDTTSLIGKYSLIQHDSNATKINTATTGQLTRPSVKLLGKFLEGSNTGATHAIHNFNEQYVGCGGLDRYLRIYDIKTRQLLVKVYLGTQISSLIILEDDEIIEPETETKKRHNDEINDDEDNEIWEQLESNKTTKLKKKPRKI